MIVPKSDGWAWSTILQNSKADLVEVSAVVQEAVVLVLLSAVLMS